MSRETGEREMIHKHLQELLNSQVNFELESAYIYFSMASYMDDRSLDGFAQWMKMQAQEEIGHAMKIYDYLQDLGVRVIMEEIKQPKNDFSSIIDCFETALEHEQKLADRLNKLASAALKENDNTTYSFLKWFLEEQVEEVSSVSTICDKLRLIGENGHGLLMLNNELGKRTSIESADGQ